MKTIRLDVDGVICNCATPVHIAAEQILGRGLPPPSEWHDFEFETSMGMNSIEAEFFHKALLKDDNLGWKIDLYPGAEKFVKHLLKYTDVVFVTHDWKGMRHWVTARYNLLDHYFPGVDVIFAKAKWRVAGDWLVDDKPKNVQQNPNRGLLFSQPWNCSATGLKRASSYDEVLEIVL